MGKALVIGGTFVALALIIGTFYLTKVAMRKEGDLTVKQEMELKRLASTAEAIFYGLVNPHTLDTANFLTSEYQNAINKWLNEYRKHKGST